MITSIRVEKNYRSLKKGKQWDLLPGVNLVVGDNGSGKSTLLYALHMLAQGAKVTEIAVTVNSNSATFFFDFEKGNPRTQSTFSDTMDIGFQVKSRWSSHGEANMVMLQALESGEKGHIVLLDEPDSALSLRNIAKLIAIFRAAENKGVQLITAVHHPWIIEAFPSVLSLEHQKWMTSETYLSLQRKLCPIVPSVPENTESPAKQTPKPKRSKTVCEQGKNKSSQKNTEKTIKKS